jgi:hypothetical protein
MDRAAVGRGLRVLRSTPWLPVCGTSGLAAVLLVGAALAPQQPFVPFAAVIAVAVCGGAAAYLLDEDTAPVLDATPTSRGLRTCWRLLPLAVPVAASLAGLTALDRADSSGSWLQLVPVALGSMAAGTGLAAALRRTSSTPGDLAAAVTLVGVLLVVAVDPLRRWVPAVPLGEGPGVGRSMLMWAAVVVLSGCAVALFSRDPVHD